MIDKEERVVLAPIAEAKWKKTLRSLAGTMPGLSQEFDYRKERQAWEQRATRTPRG
jgi:hypothetical protein